jgi:hypothetical protein
MAGISTLTRSARRVLPPPSSIKVGGIGGALVAPRSIHHRLRGATANLPVFMTRGDALRATLGTTKRDHLRGEGRLVDNGLGLTNEGYLQFVRKARQ